MSRIGRKPIVIPAGVTVTVDEAAHAVTVKGPKGSLNSNYHPLMTVKVEGNEVLVTRPNDEPKARSLHGLTRALLHNIEMAEVFAKSEVKVWECRNCGHIVVGTQAPEVCPTCNHPQSYFEVHAENY